MQGFGLSSARQKARPPGFQRFGIVKAEDFDVEHRQTRLLDCRQDLRQGRNVTTRKDVPCDPGIGCTRPARSADRMDKGNPVRAQARCNLSEIFLIVGHSDMLEHSHRDDLVILIRKRPVILDPERGLVAEPLIRCTLAS